MSTPDTAGKPDFADCRQRFAKGPPLQLALREVQRLVERWDFWAGLLAVTVVLAVAAPFNTADELNFVERLAYWGGVCVVTYLPATFCSVFVGNTLERVGWHPLPSWAMGGLAAAIPVIGVVVAINVHVVGFSNAYGTTLPIFALQCTAISVAVVAMHYLLRSPTDTDEEAAPDVPPSEWPLVLRLPHSKRGPVTRMTMQDHYVEITTARGSELVLLRMADAVAEADPAGLQIHRSHWVHPANVIGSRRQGGKVWLTLDDGAELPVSRGRMAAVREAGLL